jgi:hypothetical protein
MVDGKSVIVRSALVAQPSAPTILVFIVHSMIANDVAITGSNAFALVSNGDIQIAGVVAASASGTTPGPGGFNDAACQGGAGSTVGQAAGGCGGGGFGSAGGRGGSATNINGTAAGGSGGAPTGNPTLVPLRGGCDSGRLGGSAGFGAGGGAMQFVSRTQIVITGFLAANGSSVAGGGSGGGILLEAPIVEVQGNVVTNGGAGAGGCLFVPRPGEDGRLDASPATGGDPCDIDSGKGGNGAAGNLGAGAGISIAHSDGGELFLVFGGYGGGGVGRIRVNSAAGRFHRTRGLLSPNPSTGAIATR